MGSQIQTVTGKQDHFWPPMATGERKQYQRAVIHNRARPGSRTRRPAAGFTCSAIVLVLSPRKVVSVLCFSRTLLHRAHVSGSTTCAIQVPTVPRLTTDNSQHLAENTSLVVSNVSWTIASHLENTGASANHTQKREKYSQSCSSGFTNSGHGICLMDASELGCRVVLLKMAECKSWEF